MRASLLRRLPGRLEVATSKMMPVQAALRSLSSSPAKIVVPTIEEAKEMPRYVTELTGEQLLLLSEQGGHLDASRERLRREIMAIDNIEYTETTPIMLQIADTCKGEQLKLKTPYYVGIYTALVAGWASLPLVFHYKSASMFNDYFVTADPPEVGAYDTWLEVGSWSWGWMEPPLGTISFFLLCIQFAREQRMSIGGKAMDAIMEDKQAAHLAAQFGKYDGPALRQYAQCIAMIDDTDAIREEHARVVGS